MIPMQNPLSIFDVAQLSIRLTVAHMKPEKARVYNLGVRVCMVELRNPCLTALNGDASRRQDSQQRLIESAMTHFQT